jgi:serine phosphatase RsbU (regulator of sigma subunit)
VHPVHPVRPVDPAASSPPGGDDVTAEVNDEQLMGFLADSANRTLELSTAVARCTEAPGLQHAVELGGDAFDHCLTDTTLHATVLDAMGHNLASGPTSAVSPAACRNARRTGEDLPELVDSVDQALAEWLPDQFRTAVLTQLDLATGVLRWSNCGHPAPLLIRDQQLVADALEGEPDPPMGLPFLLAGRPRQIREYALQPGDRVLLYTDGVTEARTRDGNLFGLERFADHVIRATAAGELAPESLRLLIHAILDTKTSRLQDDATILLLERNPSAPGS